MKIVVGLGNPGREYAATRHNLGFMVVDALARRLGATTVRPRFKAEISEAVRNGEKIVLVKPQTYMNLSGHAVREIVHWHRAPRANLLVVLDELDLPFGAIRLRAEGSAGGHNGLAHIIEQLGGRDIARLRIGIGRGTTAATAQVLSRFAPAEQAELPAIVDAAADCAMAWLDDGIVAAMNRCNRRGAGGSDDAGERESKPRNGGGSRESLR
ncbi:MAG TPA: aminoacyl-tRNA hydrolase [Thermomicrobiales bacterium]|jgi:PTH1 family peptidyl-tRNA hydrolase|nr:aminoacyl-tRNA hydrolase [Thermomicrobiales bacterium]